MPESGRETTGIAGLDALISGGLPEGSTVMLVGPPGSGKSTFCMEFAYAGLSAGEKCVYITTTEAPDAVRKKMALFGWDTAPFDRNLAFVDCYSWRTQERQSKYAIESLQDLTGLAIAVKQAVADLGLKRGRVVLDSASDFLLYCDEKSVFKFLQVFAGEVKRVKSVAALVVEEGLHPREQVTTLNYFSDGAIRFETRERRRMLRIERMGGTRHPLEWVGLEIRNAGLELSVREFFR
jgi:KaiC/GvpD/RAD55 family RecA-like ATPase